MARSRHGPIPLPPAIPVNVKSALLLLVVVVIVVGATGGEAAAASIGNAVGEAVHLVRVAWNAMIDNGGSTSG